jgi:hypothetical protein|tara:strand:+ start:264 stop:449 length:186 start_codon:yes stop_codon:yes gene_type:complete
MKVQDIIDVLNKKDPDEELIVAWWDQECFDVSKETWDDKVYKIEKYLDTSIIHEWIAEGLD